MMDEVTTWSDSKVENNSPWEGFDIKQLITSTREELDGDSSTPYESIRQSELPKRVWGKLLEKAGEVVRKDPKQIDQALDMMLADGAISMEQSGDQDGFLNRALIVSWLALEEKVCLENKTNEVKQPTTLPTQDLVIEIDHAKVGEQVTEVTETDYFKNLNKKAREIRESRGVGVADVIEKPTQTQPVSESGGEVVSEKEQAITAEALGEITKQFGTVAVDLLREHLEKGSEINAVGFENMGVLIRAAHDQVHRLIPQELKIGIDREKVAEEVAHLTENFDLDELAEKARKMREQRSVAR